MERARPGPVLVANRGEVAVRIVRACRELGLRSIVVHTDVDAGALPTRVADTTVCVPSYLDVDAVVGAALAHGARAVHPGYGLLAEDAGFARAVTDAGLVFVGPPAEVVAAMGDKVRARALARESAVPVLDGTEEAVDAAPAGDAAARIGFPLLVKAAHGGGGRGMRVVASADELPGALAAAGREAAAAFGRGEVFLERHIARARHVEVQILADHHGAVAVLGDRDCTVQRRHQKLLEEAPAPDLPDAVRTELHEASRRLATAVGYRGAGTVEFLLDRDTGGPAFLEMNTRLQVEHGVTEMVTGVDLVVAQLRIAAGEPLGEVLGGSILDGRVVVRGHAVQARIAAEDPWEGFRPAPGQVTALTLPSGPWVRCDLGVEAGDAVPGAYDSLLGKVHAWGPDRATACARLSAALDDLVLTGVPTTAPYLRAVLDRPDHAAMEHDTGSVERDWAPDATARPTPTRREPATTRAVHLATDRGPLALRVPRHRAGATGAAAEAPRPERRGPATGSTPTGDPVAPMDATVVEVVVAPGDDVDAGAVLVVLEAMKMELPVRASRATRVDAVHVAPGDRVTAGSALVAVTAAVPEP
ncbi:acetyl/propionyl/methylcrotonyl-CoA carboxylase subunit alpha [Actinomycetospora chibensis]|uniref:Acetyl/propionyl/methylcrotonyl-CoA carboxylase subunit alpha n=1 Tax=Actinomycetospora chibensis TaxID=663606 RepID=A0ABV9RSY2_9PSEU|nr:biotin carboxylase N-terminal domain-containing protein [Actinomycetospora chibensis]MDD7926470.1 biotin carboxylase N-terminal domain-containing protein [Actinomycetospora chibensis]